MNEVERFEFTADNELVEEVAEGVEGGENTSIKFAEPLLGELVVEVEKTGFLDGSVLEEYIFYSVFLVFFFLFLFFCFFLAG